MEMKDVKRTLQLRVEVVARSDGTDRADSVESEIKVLLGLDKVAVLLLLNKDLIRFLLGRLRSDFPQLTCTGYLASMMDLV